MSFLERFIEWLKGRWHFYRDVYDSWIEDDGAVLSAAAAYYLALSFFPALICIITGLGIFLEFTQWGASAEEQVLAALADQISPDLQRQAASALSNIRQATPISGPLGIFGTFLAALGGFVQCERAFNAIWKKPDQAGGMLAAIRHLFRERLVAVIAIIALSAFVVFIFLAGTTLQFIRSYSEQVVVLPGYAWSAVQVGTTLTANFLAFTLIYRWLPKSNVHWRAALRGGLSAAIAWEIGRAALAKFLIAGKYTSAYGIIGSFIAIMVWCYYAMTVLFLGAEIVYMSDKWKKTGRPNPKAIPAEQSAQTSPPPS